MSACEIINLQGDFEYESNIVKQSNVVKTYLICEFHYQALSSNSDLSVHLVSLCISYICEGVFSNAVSSRKLRSHILSDYIRSPLSAALNDGELTCKLQLMDLHVSTSSKRSVVQVSRKHYGSSRLGFLGCCFRSTSEPADSSVTSSLTSDAEWTTVQCICCVLTGFQQQGSAVPSYLSPAYSVQLSFSPSPHRRQTPIGTPTLSIPSTFELYLQHPQRKSRRCKTRSASKRRLQSVRMKCQLVDGVQSHVADTSIVSSPNCGIEPERNLETISSTMHHPVSDSPGRLLVPSLAEIYNMPEYWGPMTKDEADQMLSGRPEGTYILRDSCHRDFVFSISFRRFNQVLHARLEVEQNGLGYTYDRDQDGDGCERSSTAASLTDLIKRYSNPAICTFYEPACAIPWKRTYTFSLQQLCRANICSHLTGRQLQLRRAYPSMNIRPGLEAYNAIQQLPLPRHQLDFLKYYHFRDKVE